MEGSSIDQAKRALELCLRTLSGDDRFNVIRFGDRFEKLFEESREYTDRSLEQAVAYVRRIDADLGGTEIYPALRHILDDIPLCNGLRRELIVLTDGQVSNEEEIVSLARSHRKKARIFGFGIGYGASESLVRGLARASGGAAEFISPDERLEEKVLGQFSRLDTPAMTDVRIDWNGLRVKQSPVEVPPIFSGDSFTVYGLLEDGSIDGDISLSAKIEGKDVAWSAPISFSDTGNLIPTFWARSAIRDLL
jgi:Ca-activated chloride channel family protein